MVLATPFYKYHKKKVKTKKKVISCQDNKRKRKMRENFLISAKAPEKYESDDT
jgi:hypothetical protein